MFVWIRKMFVYISENPTTLYHFKCVPWEYRNMKNYVSKFLLGTFKMCVRNGAIGITRISLSFHYNYIFTYWAHFWKVVSQPTVLTVRIVDILVDSSLDRKKFLRMSVTKNLTATLLLRGEEILETTLFIVKLQQKASVVLIPIRTLPWHVQL